MKAKASSGGGGFEVAAGTTARCRLILPNLPQRVYLMGVLVKLVAENADTLKSSGR
jgi:hypothetical protein